ncbi:pheromone A receptor-domain-containing protein [Mycena pura]|uniref:Pheromone A receptor-domain-containing protein n=1 Tax=Mycena pura TaxID=153505 RepID=A0AAD6YR21_9AGAR|nr:pheromone A receptor-domain-containing protein [Mycena pura]
MMAVDPTYPLYPILCIVSAVFMFLILSHSFIRQSWNLAVTLLCIGLFLDNLTHGINAVVWRDNADIKVPVYCDIISRLQFFMNFLPSICSLLITRKLYIISTMRDVGPPNRKTRLIDLGIEWGWGLGYPLFMTVVIYTLCQDTRFIVLQGFGCASSTSDSWFSVVVISILPLIPPLISIFFYCPLIIRTLYVRSRRLNDFLQTNGSMSRASYMRILALGCLDIVITLPISIINLVSFFATLTGESSLPAYVGWQANHADFSPFGIPYADLTDTPWDSFTTYFDYGQYAVLAVAIFALFGLTSSARSAYWSRFSFVCKLVGLKPPVRRGQSDSVKLDSITFAPGHMHAASMPQEDLGSTAFGTSESKPESDSTPVASTQHSKSLNLIV